MIDKKLKKEVWKKRAGLELIEAINRKLAQMLVICQRSSFLQSAEEMEKLIQELCQSFDRLYEYMMRPRRVEK